MLLQGCVIVAVTAAIFPCHWRCHARASAQHSYFLVPLRHKDRWVPRSLLCDLKQRRPGDGDGNENTHDRATKTIANRKWDSLIQMRGGDSSATAAATSTSDSNKSNGKSNGKSNDKPNSKKRRRKKKTLTTKDDNEQHDSTLSATPGNMNNDNEKHTAINTIKEKQRDRKALYDAMRGTDSAQALGDAIRERGNLLLNDDILKNGINNNNGVDDFQSSLSSLGISIGTSETNNNNNPTTLASNNKRYNINNNRKSTHAMLDSYNNSDNNVNAFRGAILANYFLQSHGGAYALQCIASLFAVATGIGCILLPPIHIMQKRMEMSLSSGQIADTTATEIAMQQLSRKMSLKLVLLRRCLLSAMAKHLSGLIAAAFLSATQIPKLGLYQTRKRIEALALDPVSQYLFYCALLLIWVPSITLTTTRTAAAAAGAASTGLSSSYFSLPWWLKHHNIYVTCLLAPILLREIVHVAWVISDVAIIMGGKDNFGIRIFTGFVDAMMSLLSGADTWRNVDSAARQKILAKLVSRLSLLSEIGTGAIIGMDAIRSFADFSLSPMAERPSISFVVARIVCARLFINFMLARRKKIKQLVTDIRGGASEAPIAILNALLEPRKSMGLQKKENIDTASSALGWRELILEGLGFSHN